MPSYPTDDDFSDEEYDGIYPMWQFPHKPDLTFISPPPPGAKIIAEQRPHVAAADAGYLTSIFPLDFKIDRGGIEYPQPAQKEDTMQINPATTESQILKEIKEATDRAQALVAELERRKKPTSPGPGRYSLALRFSGGSREYEFLLLILSDGRVYTTGGGDSGYHKDWTGFVNWIKREGVKVRNIQRMALSHTVPCSNVGLA